jgi:hypothetical protein
MPEPERTFADGDFVRVASRYEAAPVIGRVIRLRGSEYHVAWVGPTGNLFEMCFSPGDMTPVAPAELE